MRSHEMQREPRAHRVAEEDVVGRGTNAIERIAAEETRRANVEPRVAQKVPIRAAPQKTM